MAFNFSFQWAQSAVPTSTGSMANTQFRVTRRCQEGAHSAWNPEQEPLGRPPLHGTGRLLQVVGQSQHCCSLAKTQISQASSPKVPAALQRPSTLHPYDLRSHPCRGQPLS